MTPFEQTGRVLQAGSADPAFASLALHLADVAGSIVQRYWRVPGPIERKADLSPVTHADRETEASMRALIEAHFPDHGIFGEEHGRVRPDASLQWVLDPIDGTRSFVAGYPIFATLIGLAEKNIPILGVIDQPITKERWLGVQGEPTICNGKAVSTRDVRTLANALVATTSMHYFSASEAAAYETLRQACGNSQLGGDAYAYAMLASGHMDIVVDAKLKPYDFCALVPVITGAGGIITDWSGAPLTLASGGNVLAAANPAIHAAALKILQPAAA